MSVVKTISVIDILNERIRLEEEKITILEGQLNILQGQMKAAGGLYLFALALALSPSVWGGLTYNGVGQYIPQKPWSTELVLLMVLGLAFLFLSSTLLYKRRKKLKAQIATLQETVLGHQRKVLDIVQQKREILLAHEVELQEERLAEVGALKECPMCAELVKARALLCRYCRHKFTG